MSTRGSKNEKDPDKSRSKNYLLPQQLSVIGKRRVHGLVLKSTLPNLKGDNIHGMDGYCDSNLLDLNSGKKSFSSKKSSSLPKTWNDSTSKNVPSPPMKSTRPPIESPPPIRNVALPIQHDPPPIESGHVPLEESPNQHGMVAEPISTHSIGEISTCHVPLEESPNQHGMAAEPISTHSIGEISTCNVFEKIVRHRGSNKCKKVARLKEGSKIDITFYQGRPVGKNHKVWSRHLGRIIRDRNICPLKVHSWNDITERQKDHMWAAAVDKFSNNNMDDFKSHTIKHMKELWVKWRATMHHTVKGLDMKHQLLKKPMAIQVDGDWEWLVKEVFHSEKFMALSKRNSKNREGLNKKLLHRTGSMPLREISWQKGGKDGNAPDFGTIYFESHKKGDTLANMEVSQVHEKIVSIQQAEPSLHHVEVVEKVYGEPRTRKYISGYGGGVKPRGVRGPYKTKNALLDELKSKEQALKDKEEAFNVQEKALKESEVEKRATQSHLSKVENLLEMIVKNPKFQQLVQFEEDVDGSVGSPSISED